MQSLTYKISAKLTNPRLSYNNLKTENFMVGRFLLLHSLCRPTNTLNSAEIEADCILNTFLQKLGLKMMLIKFKRRQIVSINLLVTCGIVLGQASRTSSGGFA